METNMAKRKPITPKQRAKKNITESTKKKAIRGERIETTAEKAMRREKHNEIPTPKKRRK